MFVYQSRFLTRGEVWFDGEPSSARVDWIYHRQRSVPLPRGRWRHFYTVLIDLRKTPAELFAEMESKTAHKITEARETDGLECERCDAEDPNLIAEVEMMWNKFAMADKTPRFERDWVEGIREAGFLDVTAAKDLAGNVLAYHLVLLTPQRARQLIAISPHRAVPSVAWRNAVSRANCLIHWHNFQVFREQGISYFDFGGWHAGTSDIRLLGINRFKQSFGGKVVREFDCEQPVTFKGRVLLAAAELLRRLKQARTLHRAAPRRPSHETKPRGQNAVAAVR